MMDQARPRAASLECHGEGGNGEFGAHMLAHRPADDLASEQVEDHGQVEPTFAGRDVGDIRQPDLIGPVGYEIPIQQVGGYRQGMLAVGRAYALAAWRVAMARRLLIALWRFATQGVVPEGAVVNHAC